MAGIASEHLVAREIDAIVYDDVCLSTPRGCRRRGKDIELLEVVS
jgi:hypothetical protein